MPTDRAQDTEAIRAALERSRASLELIGDGDWTPQDFAHSSLCDVAGRLVARLEAAEALIAAHEFTVGDQCPVCAAALAAAAPGETGQTP